MDFRNLGRSGLLVSSVGLGCDNFGHRCDPDQTTRIVHCALDLGINLFDTADIYGPGGLSEEYLGKALKGRRQDVIVASKFVGPTGPGLIHHGASRRHIMMAVEDSLRRLGTDWIDLYQLHAPYPLGPIEETLRALDDLVHQGKVRYLGTCNFPAWQLVDASWIARSEHLNRFISAQNAYNLLDRQIERELMPSCREHGVGILPYFPLASGFLTGKYQRGERAPEDARLSNPDPSTEALVGLPDAVVRQSMPEALRWLTHQMIFTDQNFDILDRLRAFAQVRGHTLLDLAMAWTAVQPCVVSVLVGVTRPEQLEQNVRGAEWKLSPEELAEVGRITESCVHLAPVPTEI